MLKLNELTNDFKIDKQPADWLEAFSFLKIFLNQIKEVSSLIRCSKSMRIC